MMATQQCQEITRFKCAYINPTTIDTYSLTDFDAFGRNKGDVAQGIPGTPAVIVSHANADSVFAYKTCQAKFNMNSTFYDTIEDLDDSLDPNTCPQANEPSHNTTIDK